MYLPSVIVVQASKFRFIINNLVMQVFTQSGVVNVNKRSPYGKWLLGYLSIGACSGRYTLDFLWARYRDKKPLGCDWFAFGQICARIVYPLYERMSQFES